VSAPARAHEVVLGSMESIREGEVDLEHGVMGDAQRDVLEGVTDRLGDDQQLDKGEECPLETAKADPGEDGNEPKQISPTSITKPILSVSSSGMITSSRVYMEEASLSDDSADDPDPDPGNWPAIIVHQSISAKT